MAGSWIQRARKITLPCPLWLFNFKCYKRNLQAVVLQAHMISLWEYI